MTQQPPSPPPENPPPPGRPGSGSGSSSSSPSDPDDELGRGERAAHHDDDDLDDDDDDLDDDELEEERDDARDDRDDVAASSAGGGGFGGEPDPKRGGFATKMFGDLAKRALMTGIGAVFMSEESLRGQLSDMKLPKEAMQYVVHQADKTKKEIVTAIARETREFLSKLEVDKVLARALVGTTVEIQTRIRVLPKEGGGFETKLESNDMALSHDKEGAAPAAPPPSSTSSSRRKRKR